MNRALSFAVGDRLPLRFWLPLGLLGALPPLAGCTPNEVRSLLKAVNHAEDPPAETVEAEPPPTIETKPASNAQSSEPASSFDVDPGSGRDVMLMAGFQFTPPETFNVIEEQEGSDFRANYKHYRWSRLSGGAWFSVTFLSGLDYEGPRAPKILDQRLVPQRIKSAFDRLEQNHALRSNGSQQEQLAGLPTLRTNVIGQVDGEDAVGHLYILYDGKHLIELVALATEANRSVLKICRESANSLARGPAAQR